jgi:hypothetical protein
MDDGENLEGVGDGRVVDEHVVEDQVVVVTRQEAAPEAWQAGDDCHDKNTQGKETEVWG